MQMPQGLAQRAERKVSVPLRLRRFAPTLRANGYQKPFALSVARAASEVETAAATEAGDAPAQIWQSIVVYIALSGNVYQGLAGDCFADNRGLRESCQPEQSDHFVRRASGAGDEEAPRSLRVAEQGPCRAFE